MGIKVVVTARYEQTFSDEDVKDFVYDEKSFEECYKESFENWRFEPEFIFLKTTEGVDALKRDCRTSDACSKCRFKKRCEDFYEKVLNCNNQDECERYEGFLEGLEGAYIMDGY